MDRKQWQRHFHIVKRLRPRPHRAKAKRIKERVEKIKEKISNIKENFNLCFRSGWMWMGPKEWRPWLRAIFALAHFKCAQGQGRFLPLQKLRFLSEMRRHLFRFIHIERKRSRFQQVSCPPWAKTTCAIFHVRFCPAWTDPYLLDQHHCPVQFEVNCYVNCASSGSAWSP